MNSIVSFGFIVAAWLIVPCSVSHTPIPFASLEACQQAKVELRGKHVNALSDKINCLPTGVFENKK